MSLFEEADIVSSYSRAQAIADGVLVDVSETAKEVGIRFPCALTAAAWSECVAWNDNDTARQGIPQDEQGRLWDVLSVLRFTARKTNGPELSFDVLVVPRDGRSRGAKRTSLRAICGPGDDAAPVITILLPGED